MITQAPTAVADLAVAAAAAAAACLASGEALTPGEPTSDASSYTDGGQALVVSFSGARNGDLVIVVDAELTAALKDSTVGELDLAAALTPAIQQIATSLGEVALGPIEAIDARLALHRAFAYPDAAFVPLLGASGVRGAVAVGIQAAAPAVQAVEYTDLSAQRLDILRGVELAATAELGRARMTVNDLLSLRAGAVIELDRAAGAPADLYVNGRLIARGEVVVVDENYGLRITEVGTDDTGR